MAERTCLAAAVDLLSRREHGVQELQGKLQRKGYGIDDIDLVIERLLKDQLLSDERYAESYVRSRAGRGCGPSRIIQELKQKGVSEPLARIAVGDSEYDWFLVALQAYEKKYSDKPDDFKERSKRINFMRYRGFTMDLIAQILDQE